MAKKEGSKGLELILLGIIAILAIVGLVLLFTKAGLTGNAMLGSVSAATGAQQRGLNNWDVVSPRRVGQQSQPAAFGERVESLEGESEASERILDRSPVVKRGPLDKRFEGGQFSQD